ncbi:hypothetical protein CDAR_290391 [Caerostris darwini]|uniref:Uncharacterized protein n=1 Tax=Caerostris darwini TaxID=1538125 RepID=A0AAV4N4B5_9ARAC|nr:hypothetical protein CDAR_290391 [Caerostris darwini]
MSQQVVVQSKEIFSGVEGAAEAPLPTFLQKYRPADSSRTSSSLPPAIGMTGGGWGVRVDRITSCLSFPRCVEKSLCKFTKLTTIKYCKVDS